MPRIGVLMGANSTAANSTASNLFGGRLSAALALTLFALAGAAFADTISFGDARPGELPKGFEIALTGGGAPPRWEVVEEEGARGGRALAQLSADRTDYRFPLAVYAPVNATDVEASVRFKPIAGEVDRAGGLVVRYQDRDNYYVARANALEDNVRFYRVIAGRRQQLATANAKVGSGVWHALALKAEGDRFTVSFDGREVFRATDRRIQSAGKVGLWTKADSVTRFDSFEVKVLK